MAAIITEQFRKENAKILLNDIKNDANYYVGIGQQDSFADTFSTNDSAPYPAGTYGDQQRVLAHLTGLFKVGPNDATTVIPRVDSDRFATYKEYDPLDPSCFYPSTGTLPCYITVGANHIYLCIRKTEFAAAASSINDVYASDNDYGIKEMGDGYTWAYLGTYDQYNDINTTSFVSVSNDTSVSTDAGLNTPAEGSIIISANAYIKFTAKSPGAGGNSLNVTLNEEAGAANGLTVIDNDNETTIEISIDNAHSPQPTIQSIVDAITNSPATTTLVTAELLGVDENVPDSFDGDTNLVGGATSITFIKQRTGGLVYGFNVINGGNIYQHTTDVVPTTYVVSCVLEGIRDSTIDGQSGVRLSIPVDVKIRLSNDENNPIIESIKIDSFDDPPLTFDKCKLIFPDSFTDGTGDFIARNTVETVIADQVDAVIIPRIAPPHGFGVEKFETLPAWYVGIYGDTSIAAYIPTQTNYHQLSLIKNPLGVGEAVLNEAYVQPVHHFTLDDVQAIPTTGAAVEIGPGWSILQDGVEVGVISHVQTKEANTDADEMATYRYYFYGDHEYGTNTIAVGTALTFTAPNDPAEVATSLGGIEVATVVYSLDYKEGTGDVLFLDNRSPIARAEGQNEELKLIIQL